VAVTDIYIQYTVGGVAGGRLYKIGLAFSSMFFLNYTVLKRDLLKKAKSALFMEESEFANFLR
jgi:hypothetical protein